MYNSFLNCELYLFIQSFAMKMNYQKLNLVIQDKTYRCKHQRANICNNQVPIGKNDIKSDAITKKIIGDNLLLIYSYW